MSETTQAAIQVTTPPAAASDRFYPLRRALESVAGPLFALLLAAGVFSVFLMVLGKSPAEFFSLLWLGAFASAFSVQNTLQRAAPLLLTALCVAVPAQLGLVIIGGEAAVALGGLAATIVPLLIGHAWPPLVQVLMALAGIGVGAGWIAITGLLRTRRGINETVASLVLSYIGLAIFNHLVEGPLRDPSSLNKPSTYAIGEPNMLGAIPGTDLHPGLIVGVIACILCWVLIFRTSLGFSMRVTGGNLRAAQLQGLPVQKLILLACLIGGGCAGLAGMIEVAAIQGRANASLIAGYGYAGILIAFLSRQNPLAIIPMSVLLGGIGAAGGLFQRRMDMPDATVAVLEGFIFVSILAAETLRGRLAWFQPRART